MRLIPNFSKSAPPAQPDEQASEAENKDPISPPSLDIQNLAKRLEDLESQFFRLLEALPSYYRHYLDKEQGEALSKPGETGETADSPELEQAQTDLAAAQAELASLKEQLRRKEAALTEALFSLEEALSQLDKSEEALALTKFNLEGREAELKAAQAESSHLKAQQLPAQSELQDIWKLCCGISSQGREVIGRYFQLASPLTFLPGIGYFNRIEQLWDACIKLAREAALPDDLLHFLQSLVEIYNAANPGSKARVELAAPGTPYDYYWQDRVGPGGDLVARPLLPALYRPSGQLAKKCLVILK